MPSHEERIKQLEIEKQNLTNEILELKAKMTMQGKLQQVDEQTNIIILPNGEVRILKQKLKSLDKNQ